MRKPHILIIFLVVTVTALSLVKAILYNSLSTSGIIISRAEQEISFYKTQNAILSEQILAASSLTNIEDKAGKSGFINDNSMMVIKTSNSLAAKP